jgi:hypothetical protein
VQNCSYGYDALTKISSGNYNCGFGSTCLLNLTTGARNSALGLATALNLVSGSDNVFLGAQSGVNYTGAESSNILLGSQNSGTLGESNVLRIGVSTGSGTGQLNQAFIQGIASVSVSNLNVVTINTSTGQLGSQAATNVGTVTQYDVLVGGAAGAIASVGPGTAGQILQSAGNAANPAYSTSTYPTTNAVSTLLYASSANVMAALATANNGILNTNGSGVPSIATSPSISGTYTTTAGNLALPTTTSTAGQITINSVLFLHNKGTNATFVGPTAGNLTNTSVNSTGIGYGSLSSLTTGGDANCGVGVLSLPAVTTGGHNCAFGVNAGNALITGSYNVFLGDQGGINYTGAESSNICINALGTLGDGLLFRIGCREFLCPPNCKHQNFLLERS